ncbi:MAG: MBL fold metallo-hydrolase [Eubacteriales bacterium]|nr:MBL fold metallo-hydrolase [Eubacteriales bacterium]
MVTELKYSNTNTYLIKGEDGYLLFDTGWAGTFPMFCKALGELHVAAQDIKYIIISHFHPDHMGIAQNIANLGATIVVLDVQQDYIHAADVIFEKDHKVEFLSIQEAAVLMVPIAESRDFLGKIGVQGEVMHTPGHSEDSISLVLDQGMVFVGDLNPLYELELHKGTVIDESWQHILAHNPAKVYYGHAKTADLHELVLEANSVEQKELYTLVKQIMKYIDKGKPLAWIQGKTGANAEFVEDVARMYLTHQNVGVQGILDRIEIKGK